MGIYALQIIRRAIKSPLLTPWVHKDVCLDPLGPPRNSPWPLLTPQTKPDYQETKNFCTVYPWSCFKATVHFTHFTSQTWANLVLFKVASSFWMWIFTKLGTGKGPTVVDHQPGQVHKVSYYIHQFLQGLQDPE